MLKLKWTQAKTSLNCHPLFSPNQKFLKPQLNHFKQILFQNCQQQLLKMQLSPAPQLFLALSSLSSLYQLSIKVFKISNSQARNNYHSEIKLSSACCYQLSLFTTPKWHCRIILDHSIINIMKMKWEKNHYCFKLMKKQIMTFWKQQMTNSLIWMTTAPTILLSMVQRIKANKQRNKIHQRQTQRQIKVQA